MGYFALMSAEKEMYKVDELLQLFKRHEKDSGSPEVQIVMLSYQIAYLTRHLNDFPSDNAAKRSLTQKVHQRRKTLQYLLSEDKAKCTKLVSMLGIRFKI